MATQTLEGIVSSVNDRGFKITGYDDWFSYSKYGAAADIPHLTDGDRSVLVRVAIDDKRFIQKLERLDGSAPVSNGSAPGATRSFSAGKSADERREIRRLACLKAAAVFGASRGEEFKSGMVIDVAERWVRWVEQSEMPVAPQEEER